MICKRWRINPSSFQELSSDKSVEELAAHLESRLVELLGADHRNLYPELREVWQRTLDELRDLRRLFESQTPNDIQNNVSLKDLLRRDPWSDRSFNIDKAWSRVDGLKLMALTIGNDEYIATVLENELVRAKAKGRENWDRYFDQSELESLAREFRKAEVKHRMKVRAQERIISLWRRRGNNGAHYRASINIASRYLFLSGWLLAFLVLFFAFSLYKASSSEWGVWTVASTGLAGALGSTLAGARTLRVSKAVSVLRTLRISLFVQPWVGAAAALVTLVVLTSEIITLPGTNNGLDSWAGLSAYGFIVGFSEPFFLAIVASIAKTASPAEPQSGSRPDREV